MSSEENYLFSVWCALNRFFLVLKKAGWQLTVLFVVSLFLEQIINSHIQDELSSMEGVSTMIWIYGFCSLLLSLLSPLLAILLIISALQPLGLIQFCKKNLNFLFLESLRASGKTLFWSLLFIIPGLVRFVQFTLVPFVVLLDPDYAKGKVDALQKSTQLVNKRFLRICGVLILFFIIIPFLLTIFDEYTSFDSHPMLAILFAAFEAILMTVSSLLLLSQWEKSYGITI